MAQDVRDFQLVLLPLLVVEGKSLDGQKPEMIFVLSALWRSMHVQLEESPHLLLGYFSRENLLHKLHKFALLDFVNRKVLSMSALTFLALPLHNRNMSLRLWTSFSINLEKNFSATTRFSSSYSYRLLNPAGASRGETSAWCFAFLGFMLTEVMKGSVLG